MKKYFVTSDIHGFFTIWMEALINNGFDINNKDHILIVCGDIIDRGPEPKKVIDFLYDFPKDRKILIMGNHEELFEEMIYRGRIKQRDLHNGTFLTFVRLFYEQTLKNLCMDEYNLNKLSAYDYDTLIELCEISSKIKSYESSKLYYLIREMTNYYETEHYVFVHGWIPLGIDEIGNKCYSEKWRFGGPDNWYLARWTNGMDANFNGFNIPDKTIVCGHYRTSYGNVRKKFPKLTEDEYKKIEFANNDNFKTFTNDGIIAIDACTVISKIVNVLVLNEDEL